MIGIKLLASAYKRRSSKKEKKMPTRGYITVKDYDSEKTTIRFWVQDVSAANFDSVAQDVDEVKDAVMAVIRGEVMEVGFTKTYLESFADVTDAEAQRETKWLVVYQDTTQFLDAANSIANPGYGKVFNLEIGTAELTGHMKDDSEEADLTETDMADLVTNIEANVRSPYNHSANAPSINVLKIIHVGRNN